MRQFAGAGKTKKTADLRVSFTNKEKECVCVFGGGGDNTL